MSKIQQFTISVFRDCPIHLRNGKRHVNVIVSPLFFNCAKSEVPLSVLLILYKFSNASHPHTTSRTAFVNSASESERGHEEILRNI